MRISRNTQYRIDTIKAESLEVSAKLKNLLLRLEEHPGTKRMARPLKTIIGKLDIWQRTHY